MHFLSALEIHSQMNSRVIEPARAVRPSSSSVLNKTGVGENADYWGSRHGAMGSQLGLGRAVDPADRSHSRIWPRTHQRRSYPGAEAHRRPPSFTFRFAIVMAVAV